MRSLILASLFTMLSFTTSNSLATDKSNTLSTISVQSFKNLKTQTVSVVDPNQSTKKKEARIEFKAYDGTSVLDQMFGKKWRSSKTITYECADGYQPVLETKNFLNGKFYFAFARVDSDDFSIVNNLKDGKKATLAPFYLVWTDPAMQVSEKGLYWPYQVVQVGIK